jgi:hypothetical protein
MKARGLKPETRSLPLAVLFEAPSPTVVALINKRTRAECYS